MAVAIDREKVLLAAQGFIQRNRYDKAVAEYQKIVQQDPDDARTLLKIGDLQSKMEAHGEAIATYERVGKHYASQGFALKAIAVYKQIREIIQKHVPELEGRYGHITPELAELYAQLGLISDALATYDEVAIQLQRNGHDGRAVEVFRRIVELDNTNPLPHLRLAEAYSRVKNIDDAINHFGIAAEILLKLKRHDDALKVLERLLHHRPDPAYARRAADVYLERNKPNDGMLALAKLQIAFQADPKSIETLALLARAFVSIGQPTKSIEVQKELARIAKEQGNLQVYRDTLDDLMRVAPSDEQVQRMVAASAGRMMQSVPITAVSEPPVSLNDSEIEELSADDIDVGRGESGRPQVQAASQGRMPAFSAPEVEVSEAEAELPDAFGEYSESEDPELHPRRVLSDAESFHRLGLYGKAITRLEEGTTVHPRSVPLRRKLRDILYEAGEHARTADEMVVIASIVLEGGDAEGAAEELASVLSFMPGHPAARQMLADMGYELPPVPDAPPVSDEYVHAPGGQLAEGDDAPEGVAAAAPLPSYDLEEVSADQAMSTSPLAEGEGELRGALPSFPMDSDGMPEEAPTAVKTGALPSTRASTDAVEEGLEEAEFFLSRGLLDDARAILEEHLRRSPNHPILLERLRELDLTQAQSTGSSGTRERPNHADVAQEASPLAAAEDRAFDIAASLDALDALDEPAPSVKGPAHPTEQVDVEEVFAKFKAGVRAQVSEADSATHYDLGLAYREMGLLQDAIDEFEVASRDPKRECVCQSMVGMIYRAQGKVTQAIDAFIKGLHAEIKTAEQEISLYYELGDAYESKSNGSEALFYFRKVAHRSPNYSDPRGAIAVRIRNVQALGHRPSMERAVGASDEFDAAFDAALGGGGKA